MEDPAYPAGRRDRTKSQRSRPGREIERIICSHEGSYICFVKFPKLVGRFAIKSDTDKARFAY